MSGKIRYVLRRHLFLLIGLLTLCLFFLVAGLDRAGKSETAHALAGPMRVLIVPMYLVWMLITMAVVAVVGPVGVPGAIGTVVSGIGLAAGLAPYVLVDYILDRLRRAGHTRTRG
uniref:Transmembrane protein n=1 Tax=Solibacter usitatus (strain Ellin6076) TaxID=234267 RepID=Q01VZ9_SOLUE